MREPLFRSGEPTGHRAARSGLQESAKYELGRKDTILKFLYAKNQRLEGETMKNSSPEEGGSFTISVNAGQSRAS